MAGHITKGVSLIFYHFKLLSHNAPEKLLVEHLRNVGNLALGFVNEKKIKDRETIEKIAYLMGIAHDFGKASVYFQNKLLYGKKTEKASHSLISGIWGYYVIRNYVHSHDIKDSVLPVQVYLAISRHHGDLRNIMGVGGERDVLKNNENLLKNQLKSIKKNFDEVSAIYKVLCDIDWINDDDCNLNEFFENFDEIYKEIIRELRKLKGSQISFYLRLLFLYSILLDADKTDASNSKVPERMDIPSDIVDNYKKMKFEKAEGINEVRERIYSEVTSFVEQFTPEKHRIMTLELPTGSGKTLTGFSLALKLREKINEREGILPRIIYSLPFLSIIDQNNHVLSDVLSEIVRGDKIPSNLLLVHHHLSDIMYETREEEYDVSKSKILTEGWNSEVIITTFFQVMHSLITHRNAAARKFHRFANSILILDEVQNIPYKYWWITNKLFKEISVECNMWIILMTATMPLIFAPEERIDIVKNPDKYYEKFNRVEYIIEESKDFSELADEVWNKIENANHDIFIILNKVSAVKELYKKIRSRLETGKIDEIGIFKSESKRIKLINLTTHILPKHRFERIREIKKNDGYQKVVISTQLVEAGVDISSKELYRDIAPMDSIFQSGGRCNRSYEYEERGGKVHVSTFTKEGKPLWKNIYGSVLINATEDILKSYKRFEEKRLRNIAKSYYSNLSERTARDHVVENAIIKHNYGDLREFKLIEEKYPKEDVFIMVDDEAKEVFDKYLALKNIENPFERKNKFLGFKREFYNYIVSVPEETANELSLSKVGEVYVIYPESILGKQEGYETKYDIETGIVEDNNSLIF